MPASPRKASTVSIIRNNSDRIEVLLMRRHNEDRFLPDYHVFPGGALDDQDYDFSFPESESMEKLKNFEDSSKNYYAHIMCGIRETFEESGLLFAVDENGKYQFINTVESAEKFYSYRKQVFENRISFMDMLVKEKLSPAVNNFFYLDRWITPSIFPIRYDARFFLAVAPVSQEVSHDSNELVDYRWFTPEEALREYRDGAIKLVMPTVSTLELLKRFKTCGDMLSFFHEKNK
jgi:8-oxo-dGTP pyrophosphatase MutT (NUDIX family)